MSLDRWQKPDFCPELRRGMRPALEKSGFQQHEKEFVLWNIDLSI